MSLLNNLVASISGSSGYWTLPDKAPQPGPFGEQASHNIHD